MAIMMWAKSWQTPRPAFSATSIGEDASVMPDWYSKASWMAVLSDLSAVKGSPAGFSSPCAAMKPRKAGVMRAKVEGSSRSNWSSDRLKAL